MLDIGAAELLLIAVIGLIVVGPERLPRMARGAGIWVSKARRHLSDIQHDVNKELELEDLKREMQKQAESLKVDNVFEKEKPEITSVTVSPAKKSESEDVTNN